MPRNAATVPPAGPSVLAGLGSALAVSAQWSARMSVRYRAELACAAPPAAVLAAAPGALGSPLHVALSAATAGVTAEVARRTGRVKAARVRRSLQAALVNAKLCHPPTDQWPDGRPSRMTPLKRTLYGWTCDVRLPKGVAAVHFEARLPLLEGHLQFFVRAEQVASRRKVRREKHAGSTPARGWMRLKLVERDLLAHPIRTPWPLLDDPMPPRSWWDPFPLVVDENGEVVSVSLPGRTWLISGESRSGKSVACHALISAAALVADPSPVEFWLWDGKANIELSKWKQIAHKSCGPQHGPASAQLKAFRQRMEDRLELLMEAGKDQFEPGDRFVPIVGVVEEFTAYTNDAEFVADLKYVMVRCLAAGMVLILTTQRPSAKVIDTDIRDNLNVRMAFRVNTDTSSDMILGPGFAKAGVSAMDIPKGDTHKGVNLLFFEEASPIRGRTWPLDRKAVARVVARAVELRPQPKVTAAPVEVDARNARRLSSAKARNARRRPPKSLRDVPSRPGGS